MKNNLRSKDKEILNIISKELKNIDFGVLNIELIIKESKIVRLGVSSVKREYKI